MRSLVLLLGALLLCSPALAQTLEIPLGQQGDAVAGLPQLGESKRSVLERFGLADEEHPAVGQPPITRWDYRSFSVYFEYDHVINSVLHHFMGTTEVSAVLPVGNAIALVILSVVLTLIGGLIPSRGASKQDPATALRTE